jgi:hypothetical protein
MFNNQFFLVPFLLLGLVLQSSLVLAKDAPLPSKDQITATATATFNLFTTWNPSGKAAFVKSCIDNFPLVTEHIMTKNLTQSDPKKNQVVQLVFVSMYLYNLQAKGQKISEKTDVSCYRQAVTIADEQIKSFDTAYSTKQVAKLDKK